MRYDRLVFSRVWATVSTANRRNAVTVANSRKVYPLLRCSRTLSTRPLNYSGIADFIIPVPAGNRVTILTGARYED